MLPDFVKQMNWTLIFIAVITGDLKLLRKISGKPVDLEARDSYGVLPIHYAALNKDANGIEIMQILTEMGFNPNTETDLVNIDAPTSSEFTKIVGIDVHDMTGRDLSAICIAIESQNITMARWFRDNSEVPEDLIGDLNRVCDMTPYEERPFPDECPTCGSGCRHAPVAHKSM